jgi:MerR family transcriptional regulator, thiopeptide resistance regulator
MSERTWRVGELASASGVSVRTLHHYDELGLLSPSERTPAGHRLYTADDVRRLHRVLALRGFGLSLADVGRVLDGQVDDVAGLVRDQLRQVEEQLRAATVLHARLSFALRGLDAAEKPSPQALLEVMEAMSELQRRLTPEEFEEMREARRRWAESMTPEEREAARQARIEAMAALNDEERARMAAARSAMMPEGWSA